MLERPSVCPACISKYPDIHGMIYGVGQYIGRQCENNWHRGQNYNPNELVLTADDRKFLSKQNIKI
jgi:hypothetical protein